MTEIRVENASWDLLWQITADSSKPLLKQLEAAGIEIPNACNIWMCAACLCNVPEWDKNLKKNLRWEPAFPLWEWEIMTCIGWVEETDELIVLQTMS